MMEPDSVELLDANKGKVSNHMDKNIINLPEYKILTFWDKIDEIGVWNWSKKYPVKEPELEQITDGYNWCTEASCCDNATQFGFNASKGYDPVSGLGTLNINNIVDFLKYNLYI